MWGGWGGNGFGRGNQAETNSDFARLAAMGNQNNNTDLLMQAINGNKDAINTLSTNLNCDVKSIDNALCSIQNAIGKVGGEVGFSKILNVNSDITTNVTKDFKELDDLKAEVKELKQLLQNVSAVRPEVIKNTPPNSTEDKKVEPEGEIKKEI